MEDSSQWRHTNPEGLKYRILKAGEGTFSYEGAQITEEYLIVATDLLAWIMYGFPEPVVFGGTLRYPQQPTIPGLRSLVPHRIRVKSWDSTRPCDPFDGDADGASGPASEDTYCPYMVMTVEYGVTPENNQAPNPDNPFTFLQVSANASGAFLNSPMEGEALWVTVDEGEEATVKNKNIPNTITEPQIEWSVTWPSIPFTFWDSTLIGRLRGKLGKVNDRPVRLLHNAPADTLLFLSFGLSTQFTWRQGRTGMSPVKLDMKFVEKNFEKDGVDVTHQHLWRPNFGWRRLKINDNDLYEQTDLNEIWSE